MPTHVVQIHFKTRSKCPTNCDCKNLTYSTFQNVSSSSPDRELRPDQRRTPDRTVRPADHSLHAQPPQVRRNRRLPGMNGLLRGRIYTRIQSYKEFFWRILRQILM